MPDRKPEVFRLAGCTCEATDDACPWSVDNGRNEAPTFEEWAADFNVDPRDVI